MPALENADAMGWAQTSDDLLAGDHPGLFRSTVGGAPFTPVTRDHQHRQPEDPGRVAEALYRLVQDVEGDAEQQPGR